MKSSVRPESPTPSAGTLQAPTAAVDNSAPLLIRPQSTHNLGKAVQTSGATSTKPMAADAFRKFIQDETVKFSDLIKVNNITIE